jgi:hypothetical protein
MEFSLPQRVYTLSTRDARWRRPPPPTPAQPGGIPESTCGPQGLIADCCRPSPGASIDCEQHPLVCQPDATCALDFTYDAAATLDLAREVPALGDLGGRVVSAIELESVEAELDNGLNVSMPTIDLYVGPAALTSAGGPGARRFATIPARPPGYVGNDRIAVDGAGRQAFSAVARDIRTPFNVVAAWRFVVRPGTAAPEGQVRLVLGGRARVRF